MTIPANKPAQTPGNKGSAMLDPGDRVFWIGLSVVLLSVISAIATYAILTGLTPIVPKVEVVFATLLINVLLIIAMVAIIAWQATGLLRAWQAKVPGARLHVRIVALFSVIAALPTILLALAATTTFSRSLDGWFSTRTREIISSSGEVARAYLEVHGQLINTDILNMARDLNAAADSGPLDPADLRKLLLAQTTLRGLSAGYVIDSSGKPIASAFEADKSAPFATPPPDAITRAANGQIPILDSSSSARVFAVSKLERLPGEYLYVSRDLSPDVVAQMRRTELNEDDYNRLRKVSKNLKIAHGLIYFMISFTAVLAAIWAGLWFAARFVAPIRRLIEAAQQVSKGDLSVALPEKRGEGDLRRLSMTFNRMTRELKTQRDTLVAVNEQLMERRRFMEAVLSGISAGVIGLDADGHVTLVSRSAEKLLAVSGGDLVGRKLADAFPDLTTLIGANSEPGLKPKQQDQVTIDIGSNERNFAVQVTREQAKQGEVGSVVTFDDVTDLVSAQRTSAWADVARRIAHEIKNPLTPIQLAAERIKRKYGRQIQEDRETFDKLTDTISRQVGDIKSMVDEFASFARIPQPKMEQGDLRETVQEPVILFRESHTGITFDLNMPSEAVPGLADRRLLGQAVTNLVKNATEAIEAAANAPDHASDWRGRIEVRLQRLRDRAIIEVIDNGVGLPKQNRTKLLEPYVTTRAKGTGLGLAIVQKIVEQHKGTIELDDAPSSIDRKTGARVRITLPMPILDEAGAAPTAAAAQTQQPPITLTADTTSRQPPASEQATTVAMTAAPEPTPAATIVKIAPQAPADTDRPHLGAELVKPEPGQPPNRISILPVPSVSPILRKNSDRVRPMPPGRTQGAR